MRMLLVVTAVALSGCAGLTSRPLGQATAQPAEGIVYHLPRADIVITVTTTAEGGGAAAVSAISIAAGGAYADLRTEYLLNVERNPLGESVIDIGVTNDGLLTTADAKSTPKLIEALAVVAEKAAAVSAASKIQDPAGNACLNAGTHTFLVPILRDDEGQGTGFSLSRGKFRTTVCGKALTVNVQELFPATAEALKAQAAADTRQGVYYRQSRPYRVTVTPSKPGFGLHADQVVLSPTRSPLRFLPYARSLFGRGEVTLAFSNGQPQAFQQTVDGEIPGLLKLPAAVLEAYFAAVGAVFNGFSGRDKAEAGAINSEIQLQLARQKLAACMAAARKNPPDPALLNSLGCADTP
jgi:hypothetical protein